MKNVELPDKDVIAKYSRPAFAPVTSPVAPVAKDGAACEVKSATGVHSQWMDITPLLAEQWLKNNFRNRPIAEDVVAAYARDMVNGAWMPTHQGIGFNDRDALIDGQHRLRAVIRANKTVRMMVTFGLASKIDGSLMTTMDCVDRGRTRSVPDQLKIQHGLKNGTQIAQVASAIAGLCFERVRRLSVGQTLEIYREFKDGMDCVIEHRSKAPGLKSAGVLGAFAFVIQTDPVCFNDGGWVMQMFEALNSGKGLETYPNVKLLRDFLTGEQATLLLSSMNRGVAELTVRVIYNEVKKTRLEKLELGMEEVLHYRGLLQDEVAKIGAMLALPKAEASERGLAQSAAGDQLETLAGTSLPMAGDALRVETTRAPLDSAPAAPAGRPSLDKLFARVEAYFKISAFIITGRGSDVDIDAARIVFIHLARSYGYTANMVATKLHKGEDWVNEQHRELAAMTAKQTKSVAVIKYKL